MFYIVAKGTGHIVTDGPHRTRAYKTFGAARATRTRLCNKAGWSIDELDIVDTKTYQPRMVTRKNLMSKQDHTVYIYKTDRRTKSGERLVSTTVWRNRDEAEMKREVRELQYELWPVSKGFRIEFFPTMKTVKNLMTGQDIEIDRDTPWSCNPASESYWSM